MNLCCSTVSTTSTLKPGHNVNVAPWCSISGRGHTACTLAPTFPVRFAFSKWMPLSHSASSGSTEKSPNKGAVLVDKEEIENVRADTKPAGTVDELRHEDATTTANAKASLPRQAATKTSRDAKTSNLAESRTSVHTSASGDEESPWSMPRQSVHQHKIQQDSASCSSYDGLEKSEADKGYNVGTQHVSAQPELPTTQHEQQATAPEVVTASIINEQGVWSRGFHSSKPGVNGSSTGKAPGTWSAVGDAASDVIVEAYVVDGVHATQIVDGMHATVTTRDSQAATRSYEDAHTRTDSPNGRRSRSSDHDHDGDGDGDGFGGDPTDPNTSDSSPSPEQVALVLASKPKSKSRSKGSKKMLKMLVKASSKFVDFVFAMPTYLMSKHELFLGLAAVFWYAAGTGLIGEAATKLSTFLPDTLQPPGFELLAAFSGATQSVSDALMERFAFFFQGWTYASLLIKIPLVLAAAVPLVLTLGFAYHKVTGVPWEQALLKIHAIVHRQPGANMVSEKTLVGWALINFSFFIGMFLVAVLFGLVSDEVKRSFRDIRDGNNFALRSNGHILLLNYNQYLIPMLRQISNGRRFSEDGFFRRPVIVMADKNKQSMDEEIASRLKVASMDIYTRSGNPATVRDLGMVAASHADTVIVLHPEHLSSQEAAEAYKSAIAMALSVASKGTKQNVVMQMPNELPSSYDYMRSFAKTTEAAHLLSSQHAGEGWPGALGAVLGQQQADAAANVQVLQMPDGNFMDRFTCHAALQPGVFRVWLRILQQGPANVKLRVKHVPAILQGKKFEDIRRHYRDCVIVGYSRAGADAVFDPVDSQVLTSQDELIMLSYVTNPTPRPESTSTYRSAAKAASERMARPTTYQAAPRKVIVAGWSCEELQDIMECFADAAPDSSQITFVLRRVPEDPSPPSRVGNVRFSYIQAEHPTSIKALNEAGIKTADAVMLGIREDLAPVEADALVLASLLQVQEAVLASGRTTAPHVVGRVQRYGTMQVINQYYAQLNEQLKDMQQAAAAASNIANSVGAGKSQQAAARAAAASAAAAAVSKDVGSVKNNVVVPCSFRSLGEIPDQVREEAAAELKALEASKGGAGSSQSTACGKDSSTSSTASGAASGSGIAYTGSAAVQGNAVAASTVVAGPGSSASGSSSSTGNAAGSAGSSDVSGSASGSGNSKKGCSTKDNTASSTQQQQGVQTMSNVKLQYEGIMNNWGATWALTMGVCPTGDALAMLSPATVVSTTGQSSDTSKAASKQNLAGVNNSSTGSSTAANAGNAHGGAVAGGVSAAGDDSTAVISSYAHIINPMSIGVNAGPTNAASSGNSMTSSSAGAGGGMTSATGNVSQANLASGNVGGSGSSPASATAAAGSSTPTTFSGTSSATSSITGGISFPFFGSGSNSNAAGSSSNSTAGGSSSSSSGGSSSSSAAVKKVQTPVFIQNPEIFLSDDISAALLTLVAAHPDVTMLIRQLLTTRQGVELYLRTPTLFNIAQGERVTFAEVAEVARLSKQTAIGFLKADGTILLVPEPEYVFTYTEGDQIVVFADDFKKRGGGWGK